MITIDLLKVLHLAKHDELLLIDDLFGLLFEHLIRSHLLVAHSDLPLFLLSIQAAFELIYLSLFVIQLVSYFSNFGALISKRTASFTNIALEACTLLALFEFDKCLLLVDCFALCLHLVL